MSVLITHCDAFVLNVLFSFFHYSVFRLLVVNSVLTVTSESFICDSRVLELGVHFSTVSLSRVFLEC